MPFAQSVRRLTVIKIQDLRLNFHGKYTVIPETPYDGVKIVCLSPSAQHFLHYREKVSTTLE